MPLASVDAGVHIFKKGGGTGKGRDGVPKEPRALEPGWVYVRWRVFNSSE